MFSNFPNGGYTTITSYAAGAPPSTVPWGHFEWLAQHAQSSTFGLYKVVVFTSGGTFNTYSARFLGLADDLGLTLLIFNTSADVILTKTSDGRQFGPSVLAPFSKVSVMGDAGFVDGFIVAREYADGGGNQGSLALRGNAYTGPVFCV